MRIAPTVHRSIAGPLSSLSSAAINKDDYTTYFAVQFKSAEWMTASSETVVQPVSRQTGFRGRDSRFLAERFPTLVLDPGGSQFRQDALFGLGRGFGDFFRQAHADGLMGIDGDGVEHYFARPALYGERAWRSGNLLIGKRFSVLSS